MVNQQKEIKNPKLEGIAAKVALKNNENLTF